MEIEFSLRCVVCGGPKRKEGSRLVENQSADFARS